MTKIFLLQNLDNTSYGFFEEPKAFTSISEVKNYISEQGNHISPAFDNVCFLKVNPDIKNSNAHLRRYFLNGSEDSADIIFQNCKWAGIDLLTQRSIDSKEYVILRPISQDWAHNYDSEDDEINFDNYTYKLTEVELNPGPFSE
jgi:hypothetical protein|tara:strand:- start:64 stop:495 length:432 start_codon:yes stop_codon:yes gene_type:complete